MKRKTVFIREWRQRNPTLTIAALAARLGTSETNLSRWETETHRTPYEALPAIAEALGVEVDDLFRDPNRPESRALMLIRTMPPDAKEQAVRLLEALANPPKAA